MAVSKRLDRIEVWSDVEASGGVREADLTDYMSAVERREINGRETLRVEVRRESAAWSDLRERKVLRTVFLDDDIDEWRIHQIREERTDKNQLIGVLDAESVKYDLGTTLIERVEANGLAAPYFELYGLTPAQHLGVILEDASTYFSAGSVGSSGEFDLVYDWDSPLSAIASLAGTARLDINVTRTSTGYTVNLPAELNSTVATAEIRYARNLQAITRTSESSKKQATRVYPQGGGAAGERLNISEAAWVVDAISTSTGGNAVLELSTGDGRVIWFDDQFNDVFVESEGGTVTAIDDSSTTQEVTLGATGHGVTAGERIKFRRNSSGADLTFLDHPADKDTYGLVQRVVQHPEIPRINNLAENAFLDVWSTTSIPDNWVAINSSGATISESTSGARRRFGSAAAHVEATSSGAGLETTAISISPSSNRPFYTAQIALWVVDGAVELEMIPNTTGKFPPDDAEKAKTTVNGVWVENLAIGGIDLNEEGSTSVAIRVTSLTTGGAEWYLDAAQLTNTAGGAQGFYGARASNDLWLEGQRYLDDFSSPLVKFKVDVFDLERWKPEVFEFDEIVLGGDVRVFDSDLGLDFQTRVVETRRDLTEPASLQIKLSNLPDDLSGNIGIPTRRHKASREAIESEALRPTISLTRTSESSTGVTFKLKARSDRQKVAIFQHTLTSTEGSTDVAFTRDPSSGFANSGHTSTVTVQRSTSGEMDALTLEAFARDENGAESGTKVEVVESRQVGSTNIADGAVVASKLQEASRNVAHDISFSGSDPDTVGWGSGTIEFADGTSYSINSGNSGNMSGLNYVYFASSASTSELQQTTSLSAATGDGKTLIAVMSDAAVPGVAWAIPTVGQLGLSNEHFNASSIDTNEMRANSITSAKITVAQLDAISVDTGTLTSFDFDGVEATFDERIKVGVLSSEWIILGATDNHAMWVNAATATNVGRIYNDGDTLVIADGDALVGGDGIKVGTVRLGFYDTTPITQPTVSGSRAGNAALTDLLTELENIGLITDNTSS